MLPCLLLVVLTALAAVAALGVTLRARPEGRAEMGIAFTVVFYALVCAPVMALGYAGLLRPPLVAAASLFTSGGALVVSAHGRSLAEHAREIGRAAAALGRLPGDAFRLAWGAKSFAVLGLACAAAAIVLSAWITYLAPSESWDGFFYHEPMVGFALQNQGFRVVSLPPTMVVQCANGYPRLCEAFALWFVMFTGRTMIEIGNTLAAPGLMLATFVIARRFSDDPVPLLGWSAAVLLMPATVTQIRSSMIDVEVSLFVLAALHYATRPVLRREDAILASLCMIVLAGAKSTALVWVPPLVIVTYGRLLLARGDRRFGLSVAAGGGALVAGVAALTFVRNWIVFHNPLWPVTYAIPRLHVAWPGLSTLAALTHEKPFREMVEMKYHAFTGGIPDIIARDYGYGVPWIVVPLGAAALVAALVVVARARVRAGARPDARAENLLLLAALGAVFAVVSPTLTIARFNTHVVVIAMTLVAWAAGRLRDGARFHEGAVAATLVLTIVPMIWTGWFFGIDPHGLAELLRRSARERATMNAGAYQMPRAVARARERELGRGELVVFTQELLFVGVLWNDDMSNRVEYVEFTRPLEFLAELDRRRPRWAVVGARSPARAALAARPGEWEYVGVAVREDGTVAYRRRAP